MNGCSSCLVILCGLPGAGKTTLALNLRNRLDKEKKDQENAAYGDHVTSSELETTCHIIYLEFDDLLPDNLYADLDLKNENSFGSNKASIDLESGKTWKQYRNTIYEVLDYFLLGHHRLSKAADKETDLTKVRQNMLNMSSKMPKDNACYCWEKLSETKRCECHSKHIIIIDDNMFYSSMRYKYFQLARKYSIGFQEIFVTCDIGILLSRNSQRPTPVPEETIYRMSSMFEKPETIENKWESCSIEFNSTDDNFDAKMAEILVSIENCFHNPVPPFPDIDDTAKEEACQINLTNVLHQTDQILRKNIFSKIKRLQDLPVPKESLRNQSSLLNSKKKNFMAALKRSDETLKQLNSFLLSMHQQESKNVLGTDNVTLLHDKHSNETTSLEIANDFDEPRERPFETAVQMLFSGYSQEKCLDSLLP